MARSFRKPKNYLEEQSWLKETIPQNTRNTTKWSVKIFEEWQRFRSNKVVRNESISFPCSNIEDIENLTVNLTDMSPNTLNFWMTKFVGEVANKAGGRYPPKTLYIIVCGINRHLQEINAENGINIMNKSDLR